MKIFLAEDDPNISVIAKMALEQLGGHTVVHYDNGEKALEFLLESSDEFDVILLDEMMPGLNGLAVCQKYQQQVSEPKPVIFLSAKSQASDIKEFEVIGTGFIPKPFDPTQLNQKIKNILQKNMTESQAA